MADDLYKVLGVSRTASDEEIKKAYRKLARQHHPENPGRQGWEEKFKEISAAHDVSRRPGEAQAVRRGGGAFGGFAGGGFGGAPGGNPFGGAGRGASAGSTSATSSAACSAAAAGAERRLSRSQGRDLETEISLSFDQGVNGAQVSVTVSKEERCPTCHGSGAKPGTSPITCPRCEGSGVDAQSQGSSRSAGRAPGAAAPARSSKTPARPAAAPG